MTTFYTESVFLVLPLCLASLAPMARLWHCSVLGQLVYSLGRTPIGSVGGEQWASWIQNVKSNSMSS
jgi:hypothetical protein